MSWELSEIYLSPKIPSWTCPLGRIGPLYPLSIPTFIGIAYIYGQTKYPHVYEIKKASCVAIIEHWSLITLHYIAFVVIYL
jgi:hypothetical protein